jgi:hypothetical protein
MIPNETENKKTVFITDHGSTRATRSRALRVRRRDAFADAAATGCAALGAFTAVADMDGATAAAAVLDVPDGTFTCSPLVDVLSRAPGHADRS